MIDLLLSLAPQLVIVLLWSVGVGLPAVLSGRHLLENLKSVGFTTWTVAAMAAVIGSLFGILLEILLTSSSLLAYWGFEALVVLLAGGAGAAVGYGAASSTRWSKILVRVIYGVLYWTLALLIAGFWLLRGFLGDCFQVASCIRHKQHVVPQTIAILFVALLLYVLLLILAVGRKRRGDGSAKVSANSESIAP